MGRLGSSHLYINYLPRLRDAHFFDRTGHHIDNGNPLTALVTTLSSYSSPSNNDKLPLMHNATSPPNGVSLTKPLL